MSNEPANAAEAIFILILSIPAVIHVLVAVLQVLA